MTLNTICYTSRPAQLGKKMSASSGGAREEILQALQLACSQNPGELKVGEEKLTSWKREKGFHQELAVKAPQKIRVGVT